MPDEMWRASLFFFYFPYATDDDINYDSPDLPSIVAENNRSDISVADLL